MIIIQIFKYSGFKLSILVYLVLFQFYWNIYNFNFYNLSNFKNVYLDLKNKYSSDDKYLAVITKMDTS